MHRMRRLTTRPHPVEDATHERFVAGAAPLPDRVVFAEQFKGAIDQGPDLGDCTAAGMTMAASWAYSRGGNPWTPLNRAFQYIFERKLNGTIGSDSGATVPQAVQVTETIGLLPEGLWADPPTLVTTMPPADLLARTIKMSPSQFRFLGARPAIADILAALAQGYPVIYGFEVVPSWMPTMVPGDEAAFTGVIQMPDAMSNAIEGGHFGVLCGYDRKMGSGYALDLNSWGPDWALHGLAWVPFAYLEQYAFDAYAVLPFPTGPSSAPLFQVPNLTPRTLPPADAPQAPWPNPMPAPWDGTISGVCLPAGGLLKAGTPITVTAQTSAPVPDGEHRVWAAQFQHNAAYDGIELPGWFWWQEMQYQDGIHWTATLPTDHNTIGDGYSGYVVRVLPASITPTRNGDPGFAGAGNPYPEAMLDGPAIAGVPMPVIPPLVPAIVAVSAQLGHAGDEVTIAGSGFDAQTRVLFGAADAEVVSRTPFQLVVRVPSGSGTVPITAHNAQGTSVVGPCTHFTYKEVVPVAVTQIPVYDNSKDTGIRAYLGLVPGLCLVPVDEVVKLVPGAKATRDEKGVYLEIPTAPAPKA